MPVIDSKNLSMRYEPPAAPPISAGAHELALQLFLTGAYSDLEVRCGAYSGKVHKAIMCTQSEWFANAVKEERFLEGETGVIQLHEDNPEAVRAMVQFLYTSDYTMRSDEGQAKAEGKTKTKGDEILSHLDVYAVADMILQEKLKRCVEDKICQIIKENTIDVVNDKNYPAIAAKVYDVSPPGEKGQKLRNIIIAITANNAKRLFTTHKDFRAAIANIPAFGADLSFAIAHIPLPPTPPPPPPPAPIPQLEADRKVQCGNCMETFYIASAPGVNEMCPRGCARNIFASLPARVPVSHLKTVSPVDVYRCHAGHMFGRRRNPAAITKCMTCNLVPQRLP